MPFCKNRVMDNCKKDGRPCIFSEECFEPEESKPITNADRIRNMSDEEMAAVIMCPKEIGANVDMCIRSTCLECCKEWLQQLAE